MDYDASLLERNDSPTQVDASATADQPARSAAERYSNIATSAQQTSSAKKAVNWSQDPAIVTMREEIRQLRGLLENQLAHLAWGDLDRREPQQTAVMRRLTRMELDPALIEQMTRHSTAARSEEHAWQLALSELAAKVPLVEHDLIDQGGIVALVGSTGVGKTTSVAKLAARYVLRHGQRHVALVTTDGYRIGAHEQLMTYGRLLGISVQVASDHKELRSTLNSLSDKRLVLIDTAGMSQRDVRLSEQFATLADSGLPIRTLLALSATAHASVLEETVRAFSSVPLDGAILTKIDEAASLGGVLSVVIKQHLPLAFIADGQRVPEDLHPARAENLVQQAAALAQGRELPKESVMAEQFGGFQTHVHV